VEGSKKHTCPLLLLCSDVMISTVIPPCICCVLCPGSALVDVQCYYHAAHYGALLAHLPTLHLERCFGGQGLLKTQQIATNW
jgi:hypothetical protein